MIKARLILLGTLLSLTLTVAQDDGNWWDHTVIYQVYPRSFQDTSGDGVGDIPGILSRLDHFQELGVETVWLSPVYESPMADFGYDISDFEDIDPLFGTLDDMIELIDEVHARGMKIIMDFVPNHSSNEHDWFLRSLNREDPYTDYYQWLDPSGFEDDGTPIPPNNWVSIFKGPAWEYREERGQFYYHNFAIEQPDLNYNNSLVRQEMNDVLVYWMDLGVDGFRFDAILWLWEDQRYLDEPLSGNTDDPDDYGYLDHIYTYNLPETREILKEFYDTIKAYGADRVSMLESYLSADEQVELYECSDFPFNFAFVEMYAPITASKVAKDLNDWINLLPDGRAANWVLGNHDNWRMGDRVGFEYIQAFNVIALSLPGVTVTYYGDEIGMVGNFDISYEDSVDVQGCNCGPDNYLAEYCSRDPERTPMQWSGTDENVEFTDPGVTPWLPVNSNYQTVNVASEREDPFSTLNLYKSMMALRYSDDTFQYGRTVINEYGDDLVLAIGRMQSSESPLSYVTLVNFGGSDVTVDIQQDFDPDLFEGIAVLDSYGNAGTVVDLTNINLSPYQSIILQLI